MAGGRQLTVTLVANTKSFSAGMVDAVRHAEGFKGKMAAIGASLRSVAGPAFLAAGAAAGAFAVKLAVDGVQAAIEEEKQLSILKQTLDNVGQSFAMDSVNKFIDDLQFASGVADDELRPAFEKIIGVTKDAGTAQQLLVAALDASVGSGKDLASVSQAIAKAAAGSTTSLKKLIPELDATKLKTGGLNAVLAVVEDRFGGSAAAAAATYEGQLKRLGIAFSELQESFGQGFLSGLGDTGAGADNLEQSIRDLQPAFEALGKQIGEAVSALGDLSAATTNLGNDLGIPRNKGLADFASYFLGLPGLLKSAAAAVGLFSDDSADALAKRSQAVDSARDSEIELIEAGKRMYWQTTSTSDAFSRQYFTLEEVAAGAGRYTDSLSLLRAEARRTTVRLGFLAAAFDTANAAMEKRQAMKDYKDALKAFIDDPTADTRDAAVQNLMVVAESFKDPTKQAEFTAEGVDKIIDAAKRAGVSVPGWLSAIGESAADQQDPIASLKQLMEGMDGRTYTSKFVVDYEFPDGRPPGGWPKEWYYATGGPVYAATGTHASDNVPAMLSRGEYVLNADTVKRLGVGTLNRINNGGSASGSGVIIENLNVTSAPGERAEESVPRALRRYAFVAGLNG